VVSGKRQSGGVGGCSNQRKPLCVHHFSHSCTSCAHRSSLTLSSYSPSSSTPFLLSSPAPRCCRRRCAPASSHTSTSPAFISGRLSSRPTSSTAGVWTAGRQRARSHCHLDRRIVSSTIKRPLSSAHTTRWCKLQRRQHRKLSPRTPVDRLATASHVTPSATPSADIIYPDKAPIVNISLPPAHRQRERAVYRQPTTPP
jgi:hypothetical protein